MKKIRINLKNKRLELKMTHEEIAELIGISRSTYTNIELGKKNPSFNLAIRIKEILKVNDEIFFDTTCVKKEQKAS